MIARDEAAGIARCLASAAPHVEAMLVLDTGSSDSTVALAEAAGAEVHHFRWCDDFAAARNAALDLSRADWNLILDADEWIAGGTGHLAEHTLGGERFVGCVPVTSEFDLQGGVQTATSWMPRILPAGVRYTGRIHEQPQSDLKRVRVPLAVTHAGYRQAELTRKKGRNRDLLQRALAEMPADAYLLYQLGKDHEIYQEYPQAARCYARALEQARPADSFRHDLVLRTLYSLKQSRRFEEAFQFAETEMPNWQQSPDFYFALGDLLLDWAMENPEQAVQQFLPMAESCWMRSIEIGERPDLEGSVHGRGSHLAAHNLAVLHDGLGNREEAEHYRDLAVQLRARAGSTTPA
ncbi:MAG: glycosyltransferase [Gammaproteobacteria bacterium]